MMNIRKVILYVNENDYETTEIDFILVGGCFDNLGETQVEVEKIFWDKDFAKERGIERKGVQKMLEFIEKTKVEYLLIRDLRDLALNFKEYSIIKENLDKKKIKLLSLNQPIIESPEGELLTQITISMIEYGNKKNKL